MTVRPDQPEWLAEFARRVAEAGGKAWLAGATVRDRLLGIEPTRFDLTAFGITSDVLRRILDDLPEAGCRASAEPEISASEAAARRDLTVNAILQDPVTGEWLDPFDGRGDIGRRLLRMVSPAFADQPLNALRLVQLSARLEFAVESGTAACCRDMQLDNLSRQQILPEIDRWLVHSCRPSIGLLTLEAIGAMSFIPELVALREGRLGSTPEAWDLMVQQLDRAAALRDRAPRRLPFMLAVLLHAIEDDAPVTWALDRITDHQPLIDEVWSLISLAALPAVLAEDSETEDAAIRRLALQVDLHMLALTSDALGLSGGDWLIGRGTDLGLMGAPPEPLLNWSDLFELGMGPGQAATDLIQDVFDLQLDGAVTNLEEAKDVARQRLLRLREKKPHRRET